MPVQAPMSSERSSSIWELRCATAIRRWFRAQDQKELDRVKAGWIAKKLGVADAGKADAALQSACQQMAADNTKHRVTFYYLVAKQLDKLGGL